MATLYTTSPSGVAMPALIYGTAWKEARTAELVYSALKAGFLGIDTACQPKHYNEAGVGEGIAKALLEGVVTRDALYIQTKYTPLAGQDPKRIPYDPNAPLAAQVEASCARSLANLGITEIDTLLLHSPILPYSDMLQVWQAMEALVDAKKVRQIGISNLYDPGWLTRLYNDARHKPAVVQNRFYADSGYDKEIRAFCTANAVSYQSFWSLTANPHLLESRPLFEAARRLGKSPVQTFYRFLIQEGITPLDGTTSPVHMAEDLEVFTFHLKKSECNAIRALLH